jgi:hypothetical protein
MENAELKRNERFPSTHVVDHFEFDRRFRFQRWLPNISKDESLAVG